MMTSEMACGLKFVVLLGAGLTMCAIPLLASCKGEGHKNSTYSHAVYKTDAGYGYTIYAYGRVLIKQEYIPAIPGNKPFCSERDADRVARTVLQKIKEGNSPGISMMELREIAINTHCP